MLSAQLLLRGCTVAQLLVLDERQLQVAFPWLPVKVIKVMYMYIGYIRTANGLYVECMLL